MSLVQCVTCNSNAYVDLNGNSTTSCDLFLNAGKLKSSEYRSAFNNGFTKEYLCDRGTRGQNPLTPVNNQCATCLYQSKVKLRNRQSGGASDSSLTNHECKSNEITVPLHIRQYSMPAATTGGTVTKGLNYSYDLSQPAIAGMPVVRTN